LARYINNENIFRPLFVVFLHRLDIYFVCRIFPPPLREVKRDSGPHRPPRPQRESDNVTVAGDGVSSHDIGIN
ncbi:hypothetical protein, partial [Serratia sp. OLFL2]|uniref:hypothetical protein n=1 Tax=Serratia sp. OLFL2 TaxID=1914911 RepID=UPI001A7E0784